MLFYAVLTVAGVIAAAVIIWMLRSLTVAGRSAYRTLSPAAKNAERTRLAHLNADLAATPAPWGWGEKKGASGARFDDHRVQPHAPASRSRQQFGSRTDEQAGTVQNVLAGYDLKKEVDTSCWPYRDNLTETQTASPSKSKASASDGEQPTKPWGW